MSSRDDSSDGMIVVVVFLILVFFGGVIVVVISAKKERDFLEKNACVLQGEMETGNRVYCGKACTRAEVQTFYNCSFGLHVVTH